MAGGGGGDGGGGVGGLRGGRAGGLHCGGGARVGAPLIRDCRTPSPLTLLGYDSIYQNCSAIFVTCMNMCCYKTDCDGSQYCSYICRFIRINVAIYWLWR